MSTFMYLLMGSVVAILLAGLLHAVGRGRKIRIPAVVLGTLGGLGAGVVLGVALQTAYEEATKTPENGAASFSLLDVGAARAEAKPSASAPQAKRSSGSTNASGPPGGMGMMGMGGMGGMGGMMGGRGPNSKSQLVTLVTKLNQLTGKPLALTLSDAQKAQVRELLNGLDQDTTLTQEQAKDRFDALLKTLEDQRATLEAAGYRWPGGAGPQAPADVPNPFREEGPGKQLNSLRASLNKPS